VHLFALCVRNTGATYTAVFGYLNMTRLRLIVPLGTANRLLPAPIDRGQPEVFRPGIAFASFAVRRVPAGQRLVWRVAADGRVVAATAHATLERKCLTTGPDAEPDVSIRKTVAPAAVRVGDRVTYTLTVRNDGTGAAQAVTVADRPLGGGIRLLSATASQGPCTIRGAGTPGQVAVCLIGTLAPGQTATISIGARARSPGRVSNRATVLTIPRNVGRSSVATVALGVRGAAVERPAGTPPFTG
jgi:uncharacterized repeat protein (TIGR01451 family)